MLYLVFLSKLLISATNSPYLIFLTFLFFATTLKLLKSVGVASDLSMYSFSISDFQLVKSIYLANFDVSTLFAYSKSSFVT